MEFHPAIREEVLEAFHWYEDKEEGLGEAFLKSLEDAYLMIRSMPRTWPLAESGLRKYIIKQFPYSVIYAIREEHIFVVAVMHQGRKPGYWKDRIEA